MGDIKEDVCLFSKPWRPRPLFDHVFEIPAAAGEKKISSDGAGDALRTSVGGCQDRVVERECSDDLIDETLSRSPCMSANA
jgi:hypothetical protein